MENLDLNVTARDVLHLANQPSRAKPKPSEPRPRRQSVPKLRPLKSPTSTARKPRLRTTATGAARSDTWGGRSRLPLQRALRVNFRRSPGLPATSVARCRADGNSTKADVGLKCRLLGVERTYLGYGRIVCR